jgi:hypothetical protein
LARNETAEICITIREKSHDNSANITNSTLQNDGKQSISFEEPSPTLVDESSHIKPDVDVHTDGDNYSESTTTTVTTTK